MSDRVGGTAVETSSSFSKELIDKRLRVGEGVPRVPSDAPFPVQRTKPASFHGLRDEAPAMTVPAATQLPADGGLSYRSLTRLVLVRLVHKWKMSPTRSSASRTSYFN